ncbi:MAG: Dps family protein [Candidatus Cyclobacteriaceae bacterium M2_1C_046]
MKKDEKSKKAFKKLGFSKLETAEIVQKMNLLLANYHVHYQKLRNYHWNVKGPDFFDIHEQFEIAYDEAKVNIDDIAERIRVFGQTPMSTLKEYLETSEIKETNTTLTSNEMVKEILNDFEVLLSFMSEVVDAAIEIGDVGTEDLMKDFMKRIEKTHWMLTAFISNE